MQKFILLPKGQFAPIQEFRIADFITFFINLILVITSILFLFSIFGSGFKFMLSGGDKDKMKTASRQLINAFIGIVFVFSVWAIMGFLSDFLGVNLLEFQIPTI